MDIGFALNYTNLYLIDTTPDAEEHTWARIGAGISSVSWDGNEESSDDPYYDGDGLTSTEVTGGQLVGQFSGHRKYGDAAQDYIASLAVAYGAKRHTTLKRIAPDGTIWIGDVTLANITDGGGDPNSKSDFSFDAHFNGRPQITEGNAREFPESITLSAVTVKVGQVVASGASVTPTSASGALVYAVEDDSIATVDADGNVKGIKVGKTKVSVKSAVLPTIVAEADVTVSAATN